MTCLLPNFFRFQPYPLVTSDLPALAPLTPMALRNTRISVSAVRPPNLSGLHNGYQACARHKPFYVKHAHPTKSIVSHMSEKISSTFISGSRQDPGRVYAAKGGSAGFYFRIQAGSRQDLGRICPTETTPLKPGVRTSRSIHSGEYFNPSSGSRRLARAGDRVVPSGGSNRPSILRPICKRCNSAKRDAWPLEAVAARVEAFEV